MTTDVKEAVVSENGCLKEENENPDEQKLDLKSSSSLKHESSGIETKSSTEILTELFSAFNAEPPVIEEVSGDGEKAVKSSKKNSVNHRSSESGEEDSAGDKIREKKGEKRKKEKKKKHKHKSSKHRHSSKKESDSSGINRLHRSREKDKDDIATYSKIKEKILKASASNTKTILEQSSGSVNEDATKERLDNRVDLLGVYTGFTKKAVCPERNIVADPNLLISSEVNELSTSDQSCIRLPESAQNDSLRTEKHKGKDVLDSACSHILVTSSKEVAEHIEVDVIPLPEDCASQELSSFENFKQNDCSMCLVKEEDNSENGNNQILGQNRTLEHSFKGEKILHKGGKMDPLKEGESHSSGRAEAVKLLVDEKLEFSSGQKLGKQGFDKPENVEPSVNEKPDCLPNERVDQPVNEKTESSGKNIKSSTSVADSKTKSKIKIKNLKFSTVFQQTLKEAEEQARKKEEEKQEEEIKHSENENVSKNAEIMDTIVSKTDVNKHQNVDVIDSDQIEYQTISQGPKTEEIGSILEEEVKEPACIKIEMEAKSSEVINKEEENSLSTKNANSGQVSVKEEQENSTSQKEEIAQKSEKDKAEKIKEASNKKRSRSRSQSKSKVKEKKKRHRSRSKSREKSKKSKRSKSPRKAKSRSRSRRRSRSRKRSRSESKSKRKKRRSRSESKGTKRSRSKCRKKSRSKSKGRKKSRSVSKERKKSRSVSKERKKSRSRSKSTKRSRSASKERKKSRSASKERKKSRSASKERKKSRSASKERKKSRSASKERKKSRSASKERKKSRSASKERKKSRSASKERKNSRSASKERKKSRSASKERKKSRSASKERKKSRSASKERKKNRSASKERKKCRSASKERKKSRSASKERKRSRSTSKGSKRSSSINKSKRKSQSRSKSRKRSSSKSKRSRSCSQIRRKSRSRSRKKSRSVSGRKSRSRSRKRSGSQSKRKSRSRSHRSGSRRLSSSRSRKRSRSKSHRKSRSKSRHSRSKSRRKSRSRSRRRSKSRRKSKSRSRGKSRSRSRRKSRSRSKRKSRSRSRRKSRSRSRRKSRSRKRSLSLIKCWRRSRSRSHRRSRDRSKRTRSKSKGRRSRSKSKGRRSRSKSKGRGSRSKSKGRRSKSKGRRSRSKSKGRRSRSRKRSGSHKRSRSRSKKRSRSRSKKRSKSVERRSGSRSHKRSRGGTHDKEKETRRSKTVEKSKLAAAGGCESTGASSINSGDGGKSGEGEEEKLDKARLLEIARKNAVNLLQQGSLPPSVVGKDQKGKLLSLKAGGKSVEELTEYCKELSRKEAMGESSDSDGEGGSGCGSHIAPVIHHPFQIKERPTPGMIGIGIRSSLPPANAIMDKPSDQSKLRMQFPVSSGQEHRKTESDSPLAICYHEETTIIEDTNSTSGDVPEEKEKVIADPKDQVFPDYSNCENMDIGSIVSQRLTALRKLQENPDDVDALNEMTQAQKDMQVWAESKSQPGLFTGSTGAKVLSAAELASGSQAWARKDQLKCATPLTGGMGMLLLQKMGWRPGEGLGKNKEGVLEPLKLDVKTDKRGLVSQEELHRHTNVHRRGHVARSHSRHSFGKHPVSVLVEICSKRRWKVPHFQLVFESGPDHKKSFLFKAIVNGVEYLPPAPSPNKKQAKAHAASICLQAIGVYPPSMGYDGACI